LDRFSDGSSGRKIAFVEAMYKSMYYSVLDTLTEVKTKNPAKYSALMETYKAAM
jgi:hypothetical protein